MPVPRPPRVAPVPRSGLSGRPAGRTRVGVLPAWDSELRGGRWEDVIASALLPPPVGGRENPIWSKSVE
ncbi:hypothetical protein MC885_010894 [Smutsia gigantea]|nr:hypothetical protein MC885_010894 [Smutsia gigantea]